MKRTYHRIIVRVANACEEGKPILKTCIVENLKLTSAPAALASMTADSQRQATCFAGAVVNKEGEPQGEMILFCLSDIVQLRECEMNLKYATIEKTDLRSSP